MDEISPAQLEEFLGEHEPFLLDVREVWEFEERRIPGTVNIPMGEVPRRLHQVPRDRVVVVVCEHGRRSRRVCDFLLKEGFATVVNLSGGTAEWASLK